MHFSFFLRKITSWANRNIKLWTKTLRNLPHAGQLWWWPSGLYLYHEKVSNFLVSRAKSITISDKLAKFTEKKPATQLHIRNRFVDEVWRLPSTALLPTKPPRLPHRTPATESLDAAVSVWTEGSQSELVAAHFLDEMRSY